MNIHKKNSVWLAGHYITSLLFSFINLKLNLLNYGEEVFGIWIILISVWGFGTALDFGLGTALIKLVAEKIGKNSDDLLKILSTSFYYFIVFGVLIVITIFGLVEIVYFSNSNLIPSYLEYKFKIVLLLQGLAFYLKYISIFYRAVLEGMNNYIVTSKLGIIFNCLTFSSVVITYVFELSLIFLAVFFMISSLIILLSFYFVYKNYCPNYKVSYRNFSFAHIKQISSFSLGIQGASFLSSLIDPLIKYIIGNFQNLNLVSVYEIARRFAVAISGLFFASNRNILPQASVLKNVEDYPKFLYSEAARISRLGVIYSTLLFGVLNILVVLLIKYWFRSEEAIIIFLILSLPESINTFGYPIYLFLIGIGKAFFLSFIQLINLLIIGISLYLGFEVYNNSLGLLGYYVTVFIVNILMLLYVKHVSNFNLIEYLKSAAVFKLLGLNGIVIFTIAAIYNLNINVLIITASSGLFSFIIFYQDIKKYYSIIFKIILKRND